MGWAAAQLILLTQLAKSELLPLLPLLLLTSQMATSGLTQRLRRGLGLTSQLTTTTETTGAAATAAAAGPAAVKSGPGPAAVKSGPAASKSGPAGPRLPSEKSAAAMLAAERTLLVV